MKPKNFLQRVLDYALSEIERRARPADADERSDAQAKRDSAAEPARPDEVAMPLSPADRVASTAETSEHEELASTPSPHHDREGVVEAEGSRPEQRPPVVRGLEAVRAHSGDGVTLRWSVSEAEVARAQRLVSGKPVLCLRVVSFSKARDDVRREVQDRPGVDLIGECELPDAPERAVVALGLRAGERFVSIAHHVI